MYILIEFMRQNPVLVMGDMEKINEVKNAMAFAKRGKKEPSMWGQRPPTPSNLRGGA